MNPPHVIEVAPTPEAEVPIADNLTALVFVGDRPVNPLESKPCAHRAFTSEIEVAELMDDDGAMVGRRVQVRLLCAECATPVRFDPTTTIISADADKVAVSFDVGSVGAGRSLMAGNARGRVDKA